MGKTALHEASRCGHLGVVKYLTKECNADVNSQYICGWIPLYSAIYCGKIPIAQYFIEECNVDMTITTKDNEIIFYFVCRSNHRNYLVVNILQALRKETKF